MPEFSPQRLLNLFASSDRTKANRQRSFNSRISRRRRLRGELRDSLRLESLEDRRLLAVVGYDAATEQLTIDGTAISDVVDVAAPTAGQLVVNVEGSDTISLTGDAAANADFVLSGGNQTLSIDTTVSIVSGLNVRLGDGDDLLRINNPANGVFDPGNGIAYDGGDQSAVGGDALEILGGTATQVQHILVNEHDGFVAFNNESTPTISYVGLEPVLDTITATTRTFSFTGGSETITLSDDGVANDNFNQIDSTLGESVTFLSPTDSLTIDAGSGTDLINVTPLDSVYAASLIVDGGASAADTLTMNNVDLINTPGRGLTLSELETINLGGGTIEGNAADIGGGVLINNSTEANTTATLNGITIRNNTATGATAPLDGGGGLYNRGAIVNLIGGSLISGNSATSGNGSGGGILSSGTLTITDSTVTNNNANRAGGGIEIAAGSSLTTLTDVTLTSNNALAGPGNGGGLHVTGSGNVSVVRGSVANNTAALEGGGLWNGVGTMTVAGTSITNNTASGNAADDGGGGVFNNGGILDLDDLTLVGNQANGTSGSGGGVFSLDGTVTFDNSIVRNNSANRAGGGIEVVDGAVTLTNVDLLTNDVDGLGTAATIPNPGNGGALHVTAAATVTLVGGNVRGNIAAEEGGGLWNSATGTMVVDATTIESNIARSGNNAGNDQGGGGVFNNGGELIIRNATQVINNLAMDNAGNGGGIMTVGGTVTIEDTTVSGNQAARAGGGIENNDGTVTVTDGTVTTNTALINGGGLHASGAASQTTVNNGTFNNNTAGQEGGGLWNGSGLMTLNGTNITDNTATSGANGANDQGGGGVFNINGTLDINEATITGNLATANRGNGGGVMTVGGIVTIDDSSIQSNQAGRAGGGIENNGGNVTITNETVGGPAAAVGNTAEVNGGGLHASGVASATVVSGGVFQNNVAGQEGGGLWNGAGLMTITGTRITQNTANSNANAGNDQGGGGVFNIDGTLRIDSATISSNLATANNGNGGGVMTVGGIVTIDDTTIQNNAAARAGGGVENNSGNVTLTGATLGGPTAAERNTADINGGGLHASDAASVTVIDGGTVQNNTAGEEGGGLWNGAGLMTIQNNTAITQNVANSGNNAGNDQGGGGVFNIGGTLDIDDANISDNVATTNQGNGGGIMTVGGTATVDNTFVGSNQAGRDGGGLHASLTSDVDVTGGTFRFNTAPEEGGGLWNGPGQLSIDGTVITQNSSQSAANAGNDQGGGGVFNDAGTLDIDNAVITSNTANTNNGNGGGVMTVNGTVTVDNSIIQNNTVQRAGGGIENNSGNVTLTNVTLGGPATGDGNTAGVNGGGLHASGLTSVTVINDGIVQNNTAGEEGGGLWNGSGSMTATGTNIDANEATGTATNQGGGGAFNESGTLFLIGVELTGNLARTGNGIGGGALNDLGTMNVTGSRIENNDRCGLAYIRPNGTLTANVFANNIHPGMTAEEAALCPLLASGGDDVITVTSTTITIGTDQIIYDTTLGPIDIEAGDGNDTLDVISTNAANDVTVDLGAGDDTTTISGVTGIDGTTTGTLDGIQGQVILTGGTQVSDGTTTASVQARRTDGDSQQVSTTVQLGDTLFINDSVSATTNSYGLGATTFQRIGNGLVTFEQIETLEIRTGTNDDVVNIADTSSQNQVALLTGTGQDEVNVDRTGDQSILTIGTDSGQDTLAFGTTGSQSIVLVETGSESDNITIGNRGARSGINVETGQDADTINFAAVTSPIAATASASVIHISGGAQEDTFNVSEVFFETIFDLDGDEENDTFNLTADGADAAGYLGRLNNDPLNALPIDANAVTRQLFIDGGDNGPATHDFVQGVTVDAANNFTENVVLAKDVGDTINVDASSATQPLDLRYTIVQDSRGVLSTTTPAATQAGRSAVGNEVVDVFEVENIMITSGIADDILTINSEIPFDIEQSNQAIRWDAGDGSDRLEVLGTADLDMITVGQLSGDGTVEPIEIDNVEFVRIDGLDGDDQLSNRTPAISVLDAGIGDDIALGGQSGDAITGGPGIDRLFGRAGNDILFSDRNFGSDINFVEEDEFLDGGTETGALPGDICVQLGVDEVRSCEVLGDGGALKDVLTWLRARLIAVDEISFEDGNEQLDVFGPIAEPSIPLVTTTEPSTLTDATAIAGLPGGAMTDAATTAGEPAAAGEMLYDVNRDGRVSALDALRIIDAMNSSEGLGEPNNNDTDREFYDVNVDGNVTALDALLVINRLTSGPSAGEATPAAEDVWASAVDQAFDVFSDDDDERESTAGLF